MDRSLKWRTLALIGSILLCLGILAPTVDEDLVPSWLPKPLTPKKINLGLDLKGGLHIVYSIDLNTAIVDRASEIERDLKARFNEEPKINATVRTPLTPVGAVTVIAPDPVKKVEIAALIKADYTDTVEDRECEPDDGPNAICFKVADSYAEGIKKAALNNALTTIRERIDEKGVAEPSVVLKDDQIIVELPGIDKDATASTRDLIARTAKLEFKVVDDGAVPGTNGSRGSKFMNQVFAKVGSLTKAEALALTVEKVNPNQPDAKEGDPTDPRAKELGVYAEYDQWKAEESGAIHQDFYLKAYDRNETVTVAEARKMGCLKKGDREKERTIKDGMISCEVPGRHRISKYLEEIAAADPQFKIPDDRQVAFEWVTPQDVTDTRSYWRSYYLERAVRLTGTAITNAQVIFEPQTNRPVVQLSFNRYGARVFGDLTAQIVGRKLATILDDKVKSAPQINTAIRQGTAIITLGGGNDGARQLAEAQELENVLKTGSLPAPLREESISEVGPTLGRDAIDKTKLSFGIGILLVVMIMVGIYRWSGWISVFSVVFHVLMTLAVMSVFKATLTLPGIAAIVLAIGMAVDGNILIYERIRDELLLGKSVRGAVDLGFTRAFSAILDGQLTTAAAAWVLLQYGSGPIKGFAVLLLVGVFCTLTTNIWVTRIFFDWYIARKKGQVTTLSI